MLKMVFFSLSLFAWFDEVMCIMVMSVLVLMMGLINPMIMSSMKFMVSMMGFNLLILSVWVIMVVFVAMGEYGYLLMSSSIKVKFLLSVLMIILMIFFFCDSLMMFYIMFEMMLLPLIVFLLGWGSQPERVQAFIYMYLYTVVASIPLMGMNLLLLFKGVKYFLSEDIEMSLGFMGPWLLFFYLPFLVKVPLLMFHLWLPKAHVESPVGGSMILAGIMLKVGFYGMVQYKMFTSGINGEIFEMLLISFGMLGSLAAGLMCLRQIDMKMLVAYSSVCHMGVLLVSLFSGGEQGCGGLMMISLSHGLTSSGLFFLTGVVYYQLSTRSLNMVSGLITFSPTFSLWLFFFSMANMSAPFSLAIMGEISVFMSSLVFSMLLIGMMVFYSFLSAAYSVYLFSSFVMGEMMMLKSVVVSVKDSIVLVTLFIPLVLMMLGSDLYTF